MISRKEKITGGGGEGLIFSIIFLDGQTTSAPAKDEDEIFRSSKHSDHIYIRIHSIFAAVDFKPDPLKLSKPRTERQLDQESVYYMNIWKLLSFFVKHIKFYCRSPKYFLMPSFS